MDQDNVIRWFDVIDRELIECLTAVINHCYQYNKVGYQLGWEKIATNLLNANCLGAVAALTECAINDVIKERLIALTLEHKGVTLLSSVPPPALHVPL